MLAKTLLADTFSVLLALGSFAFYLAGFFYPEVHRRTDLVWSGLGLIYAALLWFCAGQMTVAVLLAQPIVVALFLGLGWQTLSVRREKTPVYQQTPISITPEVVSDWSKNRLNQLRIAPKASVPVRLEKRASGEQLDPRRRRAYDYEFVEDGLVEAAPATNPIAEATDALSKVLSLEVRVLEAEQLDGGPDEMIVEVPPSVEAKIISVDVPDVTEPVVTDPVVTEPVVTGPDAADSESADSESADLVETEPLAADQAATDARDIENVSDAVDAAVATQEPAQVLSNVAKNEPRPDLAPLSNPAVVGNTLDSDLDRRASDSGLFSSDASDAIDSVSNASAANASEEDWGDELFDAPPIEGTSVSVAEPSEPPPAQRSAGSAGSGAKPISATREKPSLLAMPVILVGWVKDVVTSLTRPKPSKPVIEIPRREPPSAISTQPDADVPPARSRPISNRTSNHTVTSVSADKSAFADNPVSATTSAVTSGVPSGVPSGAPQSAESNWDDEKIGASDIAGGAAIAPPADNWEESNWDD